MCGCVNFIFETSLSLQSSLHQRWCSTWIGAFLEFIPKFMDKVLQTFELQLFLALAVGFKTLRANFLPAIAKLNKNVMKQKDVKPKTHVNKSHEKKIRNLRKSFFA